MYPMETRDYIIEKAYKLFLNHSYEAVSISMISKEIGLTKGALYHHFKNKEELFRAVIDKKFSIINMNLPTDSENITLQEYTQLCIDKAYVTLKDLYRSADNYTHINFLSLLADGFRHYKGFSEIKLKFIEDSTRSVEDIVKKAIVRKEIRNDIDTRIVAMQYFSLSIGLAIDIIHNKTIEEAIETMSNQLNLFYKLLKI